MNKTFRETIFEYYKLWAEVLKSKNIPDYMATPETFGKEVTRVIWAEIGKGKEQRGGK